MSFDGIIKNDFGQPLEMTLIDIDTNSPADISTYISSQEMIFTDPLFESFTRSANFTDTGTNGKIRYIVESGFLNQSGEWTARARVTSGSAVLTSDKIIFKVLE